MSDENPYQYDIFISYSSLDGEWVRTRLVPALRAAGLTVCIDRETFDSSTALQNIENAVAVSRHTLLILSRNWVKSEWTELESLLAQHADPTGKRSKAVPLLLERQVLRELPLRIAILSHFDFSGRRSETEELDRLIQTLQGKVQRPREAAYGEAMDDRNRRTMLQRVEEFWIRGVLRQKLADRPQLTLGVLRHHAAVAKPLSEAVGESERPPEMLQHEEDIFAAFQAADQSLLILGDPGSGKTTALLMLAREAINAVREDPLAPVPVVFTLSSWKSGTIEDWLVGELVTKYQIPAKHGERWIEHDQLLLLFDGLDEVPEERRAQCLGELRAFLTRHGLAQIAICSRTSDYERLQMQLQLQSAIVLRPLTFEQLDAYLKAGGPSLATLRHVLIEDPQLCQLATSPLMLSVMTTAFREGGVDFPLHGTQVERQAYVFDKYLEQAVGRRTSPLPLEKEEFLRRLRWLARRMTDYGQTVFLVELLQPYWLRRGRLLYQTLITLAAMFLIHLPVFLLIAVALLRQDLFHSGDQLAEATTSQAVLNSETPGSNLFWLNYLFGLGLYTLTWGRNLGPLALREIQPVQTIRWSWRPACLATAGVALGIFTLFSGLICYFVAGMAVAGIVGFLLGLALKQGSVEKNKIGRIQTVTGGAIVTLILLYQVINMALRYASAPADSAMAADARTLGYVILFLAPPVFLLSGIRWRGLEEIPLRASGMLPTARNAILIGLASCMVVVATLYAINWSDTEFASAASFGYLVGIVAAFYFGGYSVLRHVFLRMLLAFQRSLPIRCRRMLNTAVDRAMVQRAGAAYLFMHRELQEHLARQAPEESPPKSKLKAWDIQARDWVDRILDRLEQLPPVRAWNKLADEFAFLHSSSNLTLYLLLGILFATFFYFVSAWLGSMPGLRLVFYWLTALLLGGGWAWLKIRWRYLAGGCGFVFTLASLESISGSLWEKVPLALLVAGMITTICIKTWGFLLDGCFSERVD